MRVPSLKNEKSYLLRIRIEDIGYAFDDAVTSIGSVDLVPDLSDGRPAGLSRRATMASEICQYSIDDIPPMGLSLMSLHASSVQNENPILNIAAPGNATVPHQGNTARNRPDRYCKPETQNPRKRKIGTLNLRLAIGRGENLVGLTRRPGLIAVRHKDLRSETGVL